MHCNHGPFRFTGPHDFTCMACGEPVNGEVVANRYADLEQQLSALRRLVDARLERGHNDTCGSLLVPGEPCSCGHDALRDYRKGEG